MKLQAGAKTGLTCTISKVTPHEVRFTRKQSFGICDANIYTRQMPFLLPKHNITASEQTGIQRQQQLPNKLHYICFMAFFPGQSR